MVWGARASLSSVCRACTGVVRLVLPRRPGMERPRGGREIVGVGAVACHDAAQIEILVTTLVGLSNVVVSGLSDSMDGDFELFRSRFPAVGITGVLSRRWAIDNDEPHRRARAILINSSGE